MKLFQESILRLQQCSMEPICLSQRATGKINEAILSPGDSSTIDESRTVFHIQAHSRSSAM
jgi:hypothetical protein